MMGWQWPDDSRLLAGLWCSRLFQCVSSSESELLYVLGECVCLLFRNYGTITSQTHTYTLGIGTDRFTWGSFLSLCALMHRITPNLKNSLTPMQTSIQSRVCGYKSTWAHQWCWWHNTNPETHRFDETKFAAWYVRTRVCNDSRDGPRRISYALSVFFCDLLAWIVLRFLLLFVRTVFFVWLLCIRQIAETWL